MPRIVVSGDSIAWGSVDPEGGGWAGRLNKELYRGPGTYKVLNLGVSGETTETLLKRFRTETEFRYPSILILNLGLNDAAHLNSQGGPQWVEKGEFKKNWLALLDLAHEASKNVVVVGLVPIDESKTSPWPPGAREEDLYWDNQTIKEYDEITKKVCSEKKTSFVKVFDLLTPDDIYKDGLHPNAEGHQKVFERVKGELQKKGII